MVGSELSVAYDGAILSLLNPKLTNRLKSENTSRFVPASLGGVSEPLVWTLRGGDDSAAKMLSGVPGMSDARLPGEPRPTVWLGSMSNVDRKDELSSSCLVLVIVRKESSRSFCSALAVPLRSRT